MKSYVYLFLGLLVLASASSEKALQKSQDLRAKCLNSPDGMASLTASEYKFYLEESPRAYDVVVFFTAKSCGICDEVELELRRVSQFYVEGGGIYPQGEGAGYQKPVYFVKMLFDESTRDIFMKYNFKSVPNLFVTTPKLAKLKESEKAEYFKNFLWQISQSDGILTSQKLLDHVNKKTGRNVAYKESIFNVLIVLAVFGTIFAFGVSLFIKFKSFFVNKHLWFLGSMTIYCICMSGIVYNIIHNVPFTTVDKNGNLEWLHSGGRSQFGAEGYIMSFAISLLGLLFIGLKVAPKVSWFPASNVSYLVLFISIALTIKWVEDIYKKKSGFYNPSFYPPAHYMKGPLSNDQGNNI